MKNQKYVKKPIPIEAVPLDKVFPYNGTGIDWVDEAFKSGKLYHHPKEKLIIVETLEGRMSGAEDDYLIHGIKGEIYICEKSIFEETYEPID